MVRRSLRGRPSLKLLARSKNPTSAENGPAAVFARIAQGVDAVLREAGVDASQVRGMGMGVRAV